MSAWRFTWFLIDWGIWLAALFACNAWIDSKLTAMAVFGIAAVIGSEFCREMMRARVTTEFSP